MAKQKVTLSLDSEIYQRTRDVLDSVPGTPSVSSLVDELLDGFTRTAGPALAAVSRGSSPTDALSHLFGSAITELARVDQEEDKSPAKAKK